MQDEGDPEADVSGIYYLRVRAMPSTQNIAGRMCAVCEPIGKSGQALPDAWPYAIPLEYLVHIDEMRRVMRR